MDIKEVGKYLKDLRTEKGYTQGELAEILNVSHQAVSRWEKGDNLPDVFKLSELARLYNVSMEELLRQNKIDKEDVIEPHGKIFKTLSILSLAFSILITILFLALLQTGVSNGVKVIVLYVLTIFNILLYVLPFALKKSKTLSSDVSYLFLGIAGTVFTIFSTLIPVIDGAYRFEEHYLIEGFLLCLVSLLVTYTIFHAVKKYLFTDDDQGKTILSVIDIYTWRKIISSLTLAIVLLGVVFIFSGLSFVIKLVGVIGVFVFVMLLIKKFNLLTLVFGLGYVYSFWYMVFYLNREGVIGTLNRWEEAVKISHYFEDSIGFIIIGILIVFVILHLLYKNYILKNRQSIYIGITLFIFESITVLISGPTFTETRTTYNQISQTVYRLDFNPQNSVPFQIVISAIFIVVLRDLFQRIRDRSLNKAKKLLIKK